MAIQQSAGRCLRDALVKECPLQVVGVINAYSALLAQRAGFKAIYLSGAGVANACFGLPDLGVTRRDDVVTEVKRIVRATSLPLLVDVDTAWGDATKTADELCQAGAAGIHMEDQIDFKRCGHRPGKTLIPTNEMVLKIQQATAGKGDPNFVVMARTDAHAVEGNAAAIDRALAYVAAGADMIFAEALTDLDEYRQFVGVIKVPVLANITEFGKTPLYSLKELQEVGIALALYPLTAFRVMSQAADHAYTVLRKDGSQQALLARMQTRAQLYDVLDYEKYESDPAALELRTKPE